MQHSTYNESRLCISGRCTFPDLDKEEGWKITETSDERTYFDIIYEFVKYERV